MSFSKSIYVLFITMVTLCLGLTSEVYAQTQPKAPAQVSIQIKTSETLSLVYMALSILRAPAHSPYLRQIFLTHQVSFGIQKTWGMSLEKALNAMPRSVPFYGQGGSLGRQQGQNVMDILEIMALQSKDLADFEQRTLAIMPVHAHAVMMKLLHQLSPLHQKHVWFGAQKMLGAAKTQLHTAQKTFNVGQFLGRVAHFYQSTWPSKTPVTMGLVPVPGKRKNTVSFAHSAGAFEIVEIHGLAHIASRLGVLVHELCHSLYDAQSQAIQKKQESWFYKNQTLAAHLAYLEINEAVATVLGNGIFERQVLKKKNAKSIWYNDKIIDAYAKKIYPLIAAYMKSGKPWDEAITNKFIDAFQKTFPGYQQDHRFVFQQSMVIQDVPTIKLQDVQSLPMWFRRVSRFRFSSPADHVNTLKNYTAEPNATAVFFLTQADFKTMKSYPFFKPLASKIKTSMASGKPFMYATRGDPAGRLRVVVWMANRTSTKFVYQAIKAKKLLALDKVIWLK